MRLRFARCTFTVTFGLRYVDLLLIAAHAILHYAFVWLVELLQLLVTAFYRFYVAHTFAFYTRLRLVVCVWLRLHVTTRIYCVDYPLICRWLRLVLLIPILRCGLVWIAVTDTGFTLVTHVCRAFCVLARIAAPGWLFGWILVWFVTPHSCTPRCYCTVTRLHTLHGSLAVAVALTLICVRLRLRCVILRLLIWLAVTRVTHLFAGTF